MPRGLYDSLSLLIELKTEKKTRGRDFTRRRILLEKSLRISEKRKNIVTHCSFLFFVIINSNLLYIFYNIARRVGFLIWIIGGQEVVSLDFSENIFPRQTKIQENHGKCLKITLKFF